MKIEYFQNMEVNVLADRNVLGEKAGEAIELKIVELLAKKEEVRMVFAAAPSQNETLAYLSSSSRIDWSRITAFNMDEYIGLDSTSDRSFAYYLNERIFARRDFKKVNLINGKAELAFELDLYGKLLTESPLDIVCMGIGENGHIAFNDPPVADFQDEKIVKPVELDHACRMQQVNDNCFPSLEEVPKRAITVTIPVLMKADHLFCMVSGKNKRNAVSQTLNGPLTTSCPASILRKHPSCKLFLDIEAYGNSNSL